MAVIWGALAIFVNREGQFCVEPTKDAVRDVSFPKG
jgi:hypothetical protein